MSSLILFDKPFEKINLQDIISLKQREVAEGLYVEYKSDFPSTTKISHSIASFANMHGGWYFVGIEDDENNVPKEFPGFDLSTHTEPKEKIRNIVVGNINPIPLFHSKLLDVEDNRGILIVYVPESYETPHITRDGRIYRRHGEGSDPIPETDRYTIDKMYEKSKKFDHMIETFCQRELAVSQEQKAQGWLEIYFLAYPLDKLFIDDFVEKQYADEILNFFKENINLYKAISMGIPFNNLSTSWKSIILRQTTPESLPYVTLTFQYYKNGNAKIIIPFEYLNPITLPQIYKSSEVFKKLFSKLSERTGPQLCNIIDGWKLYNTYLILVGKYVELLRKSGGQDFILARYRLINTWRHVLFFDSQGYVNHLDKFGVPVCLRNKSDIPGWTNNNFIKDKVPEENTGLSGQFVYILECLGLNPMSFLDMTKDWITYLKTMQQGQNTILRANGEPPHPSK